MKWGVIGAMILAACGWFLWQHEEPTQASQRMPDWVSINSAQVSSITMQKNNEAAIELHRQGDSWTVNGQPADAEAVRRLLDDMAAMRPVRVVTRKRDHDAELGLDAHGTRLTLKDASGQVLLDATVGKQGANLISTYLRRQGEDAVLAVNKPLVWQLNRPAKGWEKVVPAQAAVAASVDSYAATKDGYAGTAAAR